MSGPEPPPARASRPPHARCFAGAAQTTTPNTNCPGPAPHRDHGPWKSGGPGRSRLECIIVGDAEPVPELLGVGRRSQSAERVRSPWSNITLGAPAQLLPCRPQRVLDLVAGSDALKSANLSTERPLASSKIERAHRGFVE